MQNRQDPPVLVSLLRADLVSQPLLGHSVLSLKTTEEQSDLFLFFSIAPPHLFIVVYFVL